MAVCRTKRPEAYGKESEYQSSNEQRKFVWGAHQIQSGEKAGEAERDEDQPEFERLVKVHALPLPGPSPCSVHSVSMSMPGGPGGRAIFPSSLDLVELGKEPGIFPRVDDQV
jgi:hypothetical protein